MKKEKMTTEMKRKTLEFVVSEMNKTLEIFVKNGIDIDGTNGFLIYLIGEKLLLDGRKDIFIKSLNLLKELHPEFFDDDDKSMPVKGDDDTTH